MITVGSLFSGIGGLELGLEWAGLGPTLWQVEQEKFCRDILARHWPDADRHVDVCAVGAVNLRAVDLICGGFPCQDISTAGKGAGLDGARSGLWFEFARIVRELRPRFVVVENVAALAVRGLDRVIGDLSASGYDAIWFPLRAADVGAPHRRERLFIVGWRRGLGDADEPRLEGQWGKRQLGGRCKEGETPRSGWRHALGSMGGAPDGLPARLDRWPAHPGEAQHEWEPPRTVTQEDHRARRLKALGNAVVPQVAYVVGCVVQEIAATLGDA